MTDTRLSKTIFLKADRETVWAYLTQPEMMEKWFHKPKTALRQGEDYACYGRESGDKLIWGTVTTFTPPDELEYSFTVGPMGDAVSTVNWKLHSVPGGTQLDLEHTGLPQGAEAFDLTLALDKGWDNHFNEMRAALHTEESA